MTFMKRKVHLLEPPTESEFPFFHIDVEKNVIDLDPGPNGTMSNDNIVEVRADSAGTLDVGPVALNVELQSTAEIVEVEMRAKGQRADGKNRADKVTRFRFLSSDQLEPRFWRIYTGQNDFKTDYQYRVNVTVRGTLSTKGQAWTGPWENAIGNGPIMINVPMADDPGVTKRSLTQREMFSDVVVRAADIPDTGPSGVGAEAGAPPPAVPQPATAAGSVTGAPPPMPGATPAPAAQPAPVMAAPPPQAPPSQPTPARQGQSFGEVSGYRVSGADTVEGFREDDYASSRSKSGNKGRSATRQSQTVGSLPDPEGWVDS